MQAIFGIMMAFFVLTQAAIVPDQVSDKQEQTENGEGEEQQIAQLTAVPSSSLQINLDYQSYLLTEVFYQDLKKINFPGTKLILPSTQKALKVIFRRIITPNAP